MLWNWNTTFEEMEALRREMNRVFERTQRYTGSASSFPPVNLYNHEQEVLVVAELPGLKKEELDITYLEGVLTLKGERQVPEMQEQRVQLRAERPLGQFEKTVRIPIDIDVDKITARLEDGILTLTLPKAEQAKTRKIAIQ